MVDPIAETRYDHLLSDRTGSEECDPPHMTAACPYCLTWWIDDAAGEAPCPECGGHLLRGITIQAVSDLPFRHPMHSPGHGLTKDDLSSTDSAIANDLAPLGRWSFVLAYVVSISSWQAHLRSGGHPSPPEVHPSYQPLLCPSTGSSRDAHRS